MFFESTIISYLRDQAQELDIDHDDNSVGFRIGIDFGDDKQIIWGNYGYNNVGELSPTGLQVDLAAKLQSLSSKNQVMLGQTLLDYINWPKEVYSEIKTSIKDGKLIENKCISPNYKKRDGTYLNYYMRQLVSGKCVRYMPYPLEIKSILSDNYIVHRKSFIFECFIVTNETEEVKYFSASKILNKNEKLLFRLTYKDTITSDKYDVVFQKNNYGSEVPINDRNSGNEIQTYTYPKKLMTPSKSNIVEQSEGTSYRGLHTMGCKVTKISNNEIVFQDLIAVIIK